MHGRPAHPDPILHRAAHPRPWLRHTVILKRVYSPRGIRNTTPQTFQVTPTLLLISHSVRSQPVNDKLFNQYGVAAAVSGGHVPRPLDRPALPDKRVPAGQQESPAVAATDGEADRRRQWRELSWHHHGMRSGATHCLYCVGGMSRGRGRVGAWRG